MEKMETLSLSLSKRKNNCSKTFAFPKLIYPLHVLANPKQSIIQDITTKMYSYLWDGKPDKIKRDIIIQDYKNGGLKMIDIESTIARLKSTWVHRIIYNSNSVIVRLYKTNLKQFWEFFFLNVTCKQRMLINLIFQVHSLKMFFILGLKQALLNQPVLEKKSYGITQTLQIRTRKLSFTINGMIEV